MLAVTTDASAHLAQRLELRDASPDLAIRFAYEANGISLRSDCERQGDTVFEHQGRTILLLDVQVSEILAQDTLEVVKGKLTLQHTNNEA